VKFGICGRGGGGGDLRRFGLICLGVCLIGLAWEMDLACISLELHVILPKCWFLREEHHLTCSRPRPSLLVSAD
jgi:hypothetical protein